MDTDNKYESWIEHPTMLCDYSYDELIDDIVGFFDYPEDSIWTLDRMLLEASLHFGVEENLILGDAYRKYLSLGELEIEDIEDEG